MGKNILVSALGCGTNQTDAGLVQAAYEQAGYVVVHDPREADVVVVETCAMSPEREEASLREIERCRTLAPRADIVVGGCLPAISPSRLIGARAVNLVSPSRLVEGLRNRFSQLPGVPWLVEQRDQGRVLIRISTGCRDQCLFCSIWRAAGRTVSRPSADIVRDLEMAYARGWRRVRLVSEDCGAWGTDCGDRLGSLLAVLGKRGRDLSGLQISLGTLHPRWLPQISDDFVTAIQGGVLEPSLQIPIQSGSDRLLRLMGRRYRLRDIVHDLRRLREKISGLRLYTDVIVGFPTEEAYDVASTIAVLTLIGFTEVSVFAFSPQETAAASRLKNRLLLSIVESRVDFVVRQILQQDFEASGILSWEGYQEILLRGGRARPVVFQNRWLKNVLTPHPAGEGEREMCAMLKKLLDLIKGHLPWGAATRDPDVSRFAGEVGISEGRDSVLAERLGTSQVRDP